jgi:TRAP transporter 4TM/12TM fusion protein
MNILANNGDLMTAKEEQMKAKLIGTAIAIVAIGLALYELLNCYVFMVSTIQHRMVFLGFSLILVFLTAISDSKKYPAILLYIFLALLTLSTICYLWVNLDRLLFRMSFAGTIDIIVGFLILALVFIACYLSFGITLPIITTCLLVYGLFSSYLGGPELSIRELITTVDLTFGSYDLWGKILIVAANVIFLFVFFGAMLQGLGVTDFFLEIGYIMGKRARSGPALAAVLSSALTGMTVGQASPNVALTGAFTIPLMKRAGYKKEVAASIEAAASGGGQIMPPIMGAGAFVMADLLSVPYLKIMAMSLFPALLYFFSIAVYVHLQALRGNVAKLDQQVNISKIILFGPLFIIPLLVILFLLYQGYPPMIGAFWGTIVLIALSMVRKETRPRIKMILDGCIKGSKLGAQIGIACATLGPIIALMTKTGLGLQIGFSVERWSGGNIYLALVIMMLAIILLGLEVPTVAAYLIAAVVAIPAIVKLGIAPEKAHMFAFYFGAFSGLTPPVGMAAIVASNIAESNYFKTAMLSVGAASTAFLVPYVFVFNGDLLLLSGTTIHSFLFTLSATAAGLIMVQVGIVGYYFHRLKITERCLAFLSGITFLVFASQGMYIFLLIAIVSGALISVKSYRVNKATA